jgi:hypothetical protein
MAMVGASILAFFISEVARSMSSELLQHEGTLEVRLVHQTPPWSTFCKPQQLVRRCEQEFAGDSPSASLSACPSSSRAAAPGPRCIARTLARRCRYCGTRGRFAPPRFIRDNPPTRCSNVGACTIVSEPSVGGASRGRVGGTSLFEPEQPRIYAEHWLLHGRPLAAGELRRGPPARGKHLPPAASAFCGRVEEGPARPREAPPTGGERLLRTTSR